jgi:hypothetical protein
VALISPTLYLLIIASLYWHLATGCGKRCFERNIEQTGSLMTWDHLAQRRNLLIACAGDEIVAARTEGADLRQVDQVGRQPANRGQRSPFFRIEARN